MNAIASIGERERNFVVIIKNVLVTRQVPPVG